MTDSTDVAIALVVFFALVALLVQAGALELLVFAVLVVAAVACMLAWPLLSIVVSRHKKQRHSRH
jgi:membrane protein implicated in regulation of membrane protease activity